MDRYRRLWESGSRHSKRVLNLIQRIHDNPASVKGQGFIQKLELSYLKPPCERSACGTYPKISLDYSYPILYSEKSYSKKNHHKKVSNQSLTKRSIYIKLSYIFELSAPSQDTCRGESRDQFVHFTCNKVM